MYNHQIISILRPSVGTRNFSNINKDGNPEASVEMTFKAMKSSGFDIGETHLSDTKRIEKLILLIMVAFVWAYKVGIYIHQFVKQVPVKKLGRKAKTIFKSGLDYITKCFLNASYKPNIDIFEFLSCT